jgi:periplasmic copper chaperone A
LKVSQEFPLTIAFEKAGTVAVPVKVAKPGAMGPEE